MTTLHLFVQAKRATSQVKVCWQPCMKCPRCTLQRTSRSPGILSIFLSYWASLLMSRARPGITGLQAMVQWKQLILEPNVVFPLCTGCMTWKAAKTSFLCRPLLMLAACQLASGACTLACHTCICAAKPEQTDACRHGQIVHPDSASRCLQISQAAIPHLSWCG